MKAFFDQRFRGFESGFVIGEKSFLVSNDFHFDNVSKSCFSGKFTGHHSFFLRIATCCVWQKGVFLRVEVIEYGVFIFVQLNSTDSDRHHFGSRNFDSLTSFVEGFIFPGSDNKSRLKGFVANLHKLVIFVHNPSLKKIKLNSTTNSVNDFNFVVFLDWGCRIFRFWNDLLIEGHSKIGRLNIQLTNKFFKSLAFQNFTLFAINGKFHRRLYNSCFSLRQLTGSLN